MYYPINKGMGLISISPDTDNVQTRIGKIDIQQITNNGELYKVRGINRSMCHVFIISKHPHLFVTIIL